MTDTEFAILRQTALDAAPERWSPVDLLDALRDPQWGINGGKKDWRSHVPCELRLAWDKLSEREQLSAFIAARQAVVAGLPARKWP